MNHTNNQDLAPSNPSGSLHVPDDLSGWIELFVDLVFVAATLIFSGALLSLHAGLAKIWTEVMFGMLWWIWLSTTLVFNRTHPSHLVVRVVLLVQMFLVISFAIEVHQGIDHDLSHLCLFYGGLLGTLALLWVLVSLQARTAERHYGLRLAAVNAAAGMLFCVCAFLPDAARYSLGLFALALVIVPTLLPNVLTHHRPALDLDHLVTRLGAFSLIMMGETFIEIAQAIEQHALNSHVAAVLTFEFLFVFSLWAAYFEDIPRAGLNRQRASAWLGLHFTLQLSIVLMGVGITSVVFLPDNRHLPDQDALEILLMIVVFFFSLIGLTWCSLRQGNAKIFWLRGGTTILVAVLCIVSWLSPHMALEDVIVPAAFLVILNALIAPRLLAQTHVRLPSRGA